jgi:hypothetical protein
MNIRFSTRRPTLPTSISQPPPRRKKRTKRLGGNAIFVERRRPAVREALHER